MKENIRIIISGGGTGGHIFPAVSIANAIKELHPEAEILFVGAEGRMEMHRVPAAGYPIKGLPVAGFDRKNLLKNIPVLIKLFKSQRMARKIVKDFRPHAAVGVGGYASGPTLKVAGSMGIPTLLQEQNSYAGVTNKLLAKQAKKICVAYEGMERFFDKDKIILTGNPVRQGLLNPTTTREEAIASFGLDPEKRTVLILGGSLGARILEVSVVVGIETLSSEFRRSSLACSSGSMTTSATDDSSGTDSLCVSCCAGISWLMPLQPPSKTTHAVPIATILKLRFLMSSSLISGSRPRITCK